MTDRVKNQPGPSTIVKNTQLWPTSFTNPERQTRVCIRTYIFKDSTKVQKFLDFLKEKFPNRNVDVKQLDNGNISVSLTSLLAEPGVNNDSIIYIPSCNKRQCCNKPATNAANICCVWTAHQEDESFYYRWACCSNPCQTQSLSKCGNGKMGQATCGSIFRTIVNQQPAICGTTCTPLYCTCNG